MREQQLALVTGAAGFTGFNLARTLLLRGLPVRALVRTLEGNENAQRLWQLGAEVVEGDIRDHSEVAQAVQGCTKVFHIAAMFRKVQASDDAYWEVNQGGTLNVVSACQDHGVGRLIHCSTAGVHGDVSDVGVADEETRFAAHDVYQHSKLAGERIVQDAIAYGLEACIVRPGAIYGPGDLRLLKLFRGIARRRFVKIGPMTNTFHLVYIDDLVDGFIRAGFHPNAKGETFIITGPRYVTTEELVEKISATIGVPLLPGRVPVAPVMGLAKALKWGYGLLGKEPPFHPRSLDFFTASRAFSTKKARNLIGYLPLVDVCEGIRLTAKWYEGRGLL